MKVKIKILKKIRNLPRTPGIYIFKSFDNKILYIGKATSLKNRVGQYFSGQEEKSRGIRIKNLIQKVFDLEIIETNSVLEALILESEYIKRYQPKFNIEGKDDKSYSYFIITKEKFPRVLILRKTDFDKRINNIKEIKQGKKFGPYTSVEKIRIALKIIRKIFPFHNRMEKTEKGCLSYQIGLCPGPYDNKITEKDYKKNMRNISLFLTGHKKKILKELKKEMKFYAEKQEFEKANLVKKQIYSLNHINDIALIKKEDSFNMSNERVECYDISHIDGEYMVASMVVAIGGRFDISKYRKFKIKYTLGIDDVGAMREVLARRFNHLDDWGIPNAIILDGGQGHLNMGEKLMNDFGVSSTVIGLLSVAKGPTRKKVDIYESKEFPTKITIKNNLRLIEKLREEAHRFAINYHRKLRDIDYLKK